MTLWGLIRALPAHRGIGMTVWCAGACMLASAWGCIPDAPVSDRGPDTTWGVAAAVETDDGFRFVTFGTSFAVDADRLVTNAHVIDALLELAAEADPNVAFVVVRNETGQHFPITAMWRHPDYDPEHILSTPDVGVLGVDGSLPSFAILADDFFLRRLDVLDEVALCGFPGDIAVDVGSSRPRATCLPGTITALRPFDPDAAATPENTHLIQHNIPASKGTSGSAIFDPLGRVVAVHNAATTDDSASNRFAIRADLVRAFLDDIDAGLIPGLTLE